MFSERGIFSANYKSGHLFLIYPVAWYKSLFNGFAWIPLVAVINFLIYVAKLVSLYLLLACMWSNIWGKCCPRCFSANAPTEWGECNHAFGKWSAGRGKVRPHAKSPRCGQHKPPVEARSRWYFPPVEAFHKCSAAGWSNVDHRSVSCSSYLLGVVHHLARFSLLWILELVMAAMAPIFRWAALSCWHRSRSQKDSR